MRPVMLHPESRGELRLRSTDPAAPIRIIQNFLATDGDVRTIREGLRNAPRAAEAQLDRLASFARRRNATALLAEIEEDRAKSG